MASLRETWRAIFKPVDRRQIQDWARDNVKLFPPLTITGPFDTSMSRHFNGPLDALHDMVCREVNVLKPVRGGGSLIGDVHFDWAMALYPGPYMHVFQTDPEAKNYFRDRLEKQLKGNSHLGPLLPVRYEWSEVRLLNNHTVYTTGPGISNLQSKAIRYLRLDECWMYEQGVIGEATGRIGDYLKQETSKILCISQGGPKDGVPVTESDWFRQYERGSKHEWEVACESCGKFFSPVFSGQRVDGSFWGMTWNHHKLPNGDWHVSKCIESIRFECQHCAHPHLEGSKTKQEWNRSGRYRLEGELQRKRQSFHWETVIDFPWTDLVELWLEACNAEHRGDYRPKLQFYQKRRAMFKDEESLIRGGMNLKRSTYEVNSEWPDERARFLTIDRQEEDLFWMTVRAWSVEKSRRLFFGKCYGFAACEAIREQFKVQPNRTLCDSGFQPKGDNGVYRACVKYGWIAVKGDKEHDFMHRTKKGKIVRKSYAPLAYGDPDSGRIGEGRKYAPLVRFSKNQMNQKVQQLLDAGLWEEPAGGDAEMEKEYSAQMSARVKKTEFNKRTNEAIVFWKEGRNDHARDLANMQVLGAILASLINDPVAERLTPKEKEAE